jgi:hypothetical protein
LAWQCHNQELGAIVQAFVEWRAWLIDTREPVEVLLDHVNLKYFTQNQNLLDWQARWAAYLSSFYFVIKHIPGRLNPADPPTRRPDYVPPDDTDHSRRVLIVPTPGGLTIQGATLDEPDPRIDIGEVVTTPLAVPPAPAPVPYSKSQDPFFAPLQNGCAVFFERHMLRTRRIQRKSTTWSSGMVCGGFAAESLYL